jgi:hypothetical protein
MDFNILSDLLGLSSEVKENPISVATHLGCEFEADPELFR